MANATLAAKVRDRILNSPETYDQDVWAAFPSRPAETVEYVTCPTTACVAGHTVMECGYVFDRSGMREIYDGGKDGYIWMAFTAMKRDDPETRDNVQDIAAELLEINQDTAEWLFSGNAELDDVLICLAFLADNNEDGFLDFRNYDYFNKYMVA